MPFRRQDRRGGPPAILYTGLELFNPFFCSWESTSFSVVNGRIDSVGADSAPISIDLHGARVVPGLIDAHVHIESSLLTPQEYGRAVLSHGVTTIIADPHEIANVLGMEGIQYMLDQAEDTPLDIFFMLPSSVPASPQDLGGARIETEDLRTLQDHPKVLGLGEVMDIKAVLSGDPILQQKLSLMTLVDGHAPLLRGYDLDRYIAAGIQSDHECTDAREAQEKVQKGMYVMIREGSTERNLLDLIRSVTSCSISRWSFATDDRHADLLTQMGSIDDCIRKAVEGGLELELALRMATLSPCDRFCLWDRGAIAPGRIADFCILDTGATFRVKKTFKQGREMTDLPYQTPTVRVHPFQAQLPDPRELRIEEQGMARVIGVQEGQILTDTLCREVEGHLLPDLERDLLKVVVCSRYREGRYSIGLVHGMGLTEGAIASSVAHDSHNLVAVGVEDTAILTALSEVTQTNGGLTLVGEDTILSLPLVCAGLMSADSYPAVARRLNALEERAGALGAIPHPFMVLSFLTLTVIPSLRITERGLYDVSAGTLVPLFVPT